MTNHVDCNELNISDLDPGIRKVVQWLIDNGFETIDSGDGVSKLALGWSEDEILSMPHVFINIDPENIVKESHRLEELLLAVHGIELSGSPGDGPFIQADYSPVDQLATLYLFNVGDNMLRSQN